MEKYKFLNGVVVEVNRYNSGAELYVVDSRGWSLDDLGNFRHHIVENDDQLVLFLARLTQLKL